MSDTTFLYLPTSSWAALAAIAAAISAIAAWRGVVAARRSTDAQLINNLRETKEKYDRQLIEARALPTPEDGVHPWFNVVSWWLDHVELTAHMCNKKVMSRSGRQFVEPMLEEWIRLIDTNPLVRDHMIRSVSGPTTYSEIRLFMMRHKKRLGKFSRVIEEAASENAAA